MADNVKVSDQVSAKVTRAPGNPGAPGTVEYYKQQIADSQARAAQRERLQAGPTTVSATKNAAGETVVSTSTPYVDLPKADAQSRFYQGYQAAVAEKQAAGGGVLTHEDVKAKATDVIAREIATKGGVEIQDKAAIAAATATRYQAVKDFTEKPVLGTMSQADVMLAQQQQQQQQQDNSNVQNINNARYAAFKANQAIEAANKGQPSGFALTSADMRALESAGVRDASKMQREIDMTRSDVSQEGAADFGIGIQRPGNPYVIEERGDDGAVVRRIVLSGKLGPNKPEIVVPEAPDMSYNPALDFGKGLTAPFENLVTGIGGAVTGKDVTFKADIEGDIFSLGTKAASDLVRTGRTDVGYDDLEKVKANVTKNPYYAAGNLVASTIMWLGPGYFAKASRTGIEAVRAARNLRSADEIISPIARVIEPEGGRIGLGVTPKVGAKSLTQGDVIALDRGEGDLFKISAIRIVGQGAKREVEIFHSYTPEPPRSFGLTRTGVEVEPKINEALIFGDHKNTVQYVQDFVKVNEKELPVSMVRMEPYVGPRTASIAAETTFKEIPGVSKAFFEPKAVENMNLKGMLPEKVNLTRDFVDPTTLSPYTKAVAFSERVPLDRFLSYVRGGDSNIKRMLGLTDDDILRIERSADAELGASRLVKGNAVTLQRLEEMGILARTDDTAATKASRNASMNKAAEEEGGAMLSRSTASASGVSAVKASEVRGIGSSRGRASVKADDYEYAHMPTPAVESTAKDFMASFQMGRLNRSLDNSSILQSLTGMRLQLKDLGGLRGKTSQVAQKLERTSLLNMGEMSKLEADMMSGLRPRQLVEMGTAGMIGTGTVFDYTYDIPTVDIPDWPKAPSPRLFPPAADYFNLGAKKGGPDSLRRSLTRWWLYNPFTGRYA